jgi:hypothetical protein
MTPKNTFTQAVASAKANKVEHGSTSTPVQVSTKTDSIDLARIEFLLAWAERKSLPGSLMNLKKIYYG